MATYKKSSGTGGAWVDKKAVVNGTKCKIVTETEPRETEWGTQDVAKIRIQGEEESKNVNLNKATINALVEEFGEDSKEWIGKVLTMQTEKMVVAGKRVTALYLLPEGYLLTEDDAGYLILTKDASKVSTVAPATVNATRVRTESQIEYPENEYPEDVPF